MLFISRQKLFSFSGYLTKQLDKKDKVNCKFYDVTGWITNNGNTHIVQYLEKYYYYLLLKLYLSLVHNNQFWSVNIM